MEDRPDQSLRPNLCRPIAYRHLLIAALMCWTTFAIIACLTVTGHATGLDTWGLLVFRDPVSLDLLRPEWLGEAMRDVTALGGFFVRNLVAITAMAILIMLRLPHRAAVVLVTITSGWMLELLLKEFFDRPRPDVVQHLMSVSGDSFPSGHGFNAAVVYLSLGLTFAAMAVPPRRRSMILGAAIAVSLLIGITRIALGVHFPTDALGGLTGGAGWALLVFALWDRNSINSQTSEFAT
jgi:undecaprenyl-diphosphatase